MKITASDYTRVASLLGVETAVVKAVAEVESGGKGGFLSDGRPVILFEGHVFWQQLRQRGISPEAYAPGNENILYPKWDRRHYRGGTAEYTRLERAVRIHEEAALSAASWGMFQLMGFNASLCGYTSAATFAEAMHTSEGVQLEAFVRFILARDLDCCLRLHDWAAFARAYNGPDYALNRYAERLAAAYSRHHEVKIQTGKGSSDNGT